MWLKYLLPVTLKGSSTEPLEPPLATGMVWYGGCNLTRRRGVSGFRAGGTGPVGQVLAGPIFQRGNSEIATFTDLKGNPTIGDLYRFSLSLRLLLWWRGIVNVVSYSDFCFGF